MSALAMNGERLDYEQQQDEEERQAATLQDLMDIAAAGLPQHAERLAYECGLGAKWKQQFQPRGNSNAQH